MLSLKRYLRFSAWSAALGYVALWALTIGALSFEAPLQALTGCRTDDAAPLPLWSCEGSIGAGLIGACINTAFVTIAWAPALVAAATVRPDALPLATIAAMSHVTGLAAVFISVIRLARAVSRRLTRA